MTFHINQKIFETFPGLQVGVIVARGVNNRGEVSGVLEALKKEAERIRTSMSLDALASHPMIEAWKSAYTKFGAKPKEHRSSVESLYRLVLNGKDLRHINTLVDIYNLISLKYMLPVGGEDLKKIEDDIELTFAGANEPPVLLLGDGAPRPPHEGEVIYKDAVSAVCRRFNWREADRTKLTEETTDCVLVVEALHPTTQDALVQATKELHRLVETHAGATCTSDILSDTHSSFVLEYSHIVRL